MLISSNVHIYLIDTYKRSESKWAIVGTWPSQTDNRHKHQEQRSILSEHIFGKFDRYHRSQNLLYKIVTSTCVDTLLLRTTVTLRPPHKWQRIKLYLGEVTHFTGVQNFGGGIFTEKPNNKVQAFPSRSRWRAVPHKNICRVTLENRGGGPWSLGLPKTIPRTYVCVCITWRINQKHDKDPKIIIFSYCG